MLSWLFYLVLPLFTPAVHCLTYKSKKVTCFSSHLKLALEVYDLEFTSASFLKEAADWTVSPSSSTQLVSYCGGIPLLGGYGLIGAGTAFSRTYTSLPTHSTVLYTIGVWAMGEWQDTDGLNVYITGENLSYSDTLMQLHYDETTWTDNICGIPNEYGMASIYVLIRTENVGSWVQIMITNTNGVGPTFPQYGIRDVKITLYSYTVTGSTFCIQTDPYGITVSSSTACASEPGKFYNTGTSTFDDCDPSCQNCYAGTSANCFSCNDDYLFSGTNCVSCHSECLSCFGALSTQCLSCNSGHYLYPNSTCQNTCEAPMKQRIENDILYCDFPCEISDSNDESLIYYPNEKICMSTCPEYYQIDQVSPYLTCVASENFQAIQDARSNVGQALSAGLIAISALSVGGSSGVNIAVLAKMIQYIRYLDISYSQGLEVVLETWNSNFVSLGFMPDVFDQNRFDNPALPLIFGKWDVHSQFLVNFGQDFLSVTIVAGILLWSLVFEQALLKYNRESLFHFVFRKMRIIAQNFFLVLMYSNLGDIFLYAALGLRSIALDSSLMIISFIATLTCMIAGVVWLWNHLRIILKQQKKQSAECKLSQFIKIDDDPFKEYEGSRILFRDFKTKTFGQKAFLFFFAIRDIVFSLIIALLFDHPLIQTILLTTLCVLMLAYLFIQRPFKKLNDALQQMFCELTLFTVNIGVLILAILDAQGTEAEDTRNKIGNMIITINFVFNFGLVLFFILNVIVEVRELYHDRKRKRQIVQEMQKGPLSSGLQASDISQINYDKKDLKQLQSIAVVDVKSRMMSFSSAQENSARSLLAKEVKISSIGLNLLIESPRDNSSITKTNQQSNFGDESSSEVKKFSPNTARHLLLKDEIIEYSQESVQEYTPKNILSPPNVNQSLRLNLDFENQALMFPVSEKRSLALKRIRSRTPRASLEVAMPTLSHTNSSSRLQLINNNESSPIPVKSQFAKDDLTFSNFCKNK